MPLMKEESKEIIELLNKIPDNSLQILFGDSIRFKNWLKNHKVTDKVSI